MIISYNWLKEYIECSLSPEELAGRLTMSGQEVEKLTVTEDDALFEIGVTPNRGDCLSVYGIARDLAACLDLKLKKTTGISVFDQDGPAFPEVKITEPGHCFLYACRRVSGVKIAPSPDWLARRLSDAGIRPINNVVDVTNYILLEFGQPLHAFDNRKLTGDLIEIRLAGQGEKFPALDGNELTLDSDMLVIADAGKAVALAGVIGGRYSEVSGDTTGILLEAACFNPATVRRTARRLGLQTESSFRFERGIDQAMVTDRLDRAVELIKRLCPDSQVGKLQKREARPVEKVVINFRTERANRLLGTSISTEEMEKILSDLGISLLSFPSGSRPDKQAAVPSWRPDLTREVDLIEEIARTYGYNRIESRPPKGIQLKATAPLIREIESKTRKCLLACGFDEAVNFSFTKKSAYYKLLSGERNEKESERLLQQYLRLFAQSDDVGLLSLRNPISRDHEIMRPDLLVSLLETVQGNHKHRNKDLAIFEIGACYFKGAGKIKELRYAGGIASGFPGRPGWRKTGRTVDFFTVKGIVESLLDCLGAGTCESRQSDYRFLHQSRQASIFLQDKLIGFLGELAPGILPDIRERVYLFQLELLSLCGSALKPVRYRPVSKYPAISRDLSVIVPESTSSMEVENYILEKKVPFLQKIKLFDLFTGEQVGAGDKSLGFSFYYQSDKGTLTDGRIDEIHQSVILDLQERFKAHLRDA